MANEHNLVPMNQRTESERREIGKAGGIASGKSRRRTQSMKAIAKRILAMPAPEDITAELMQRGFEREECTLQLLMVVKCAQKASDGDLKALQFLNSLITDDPRDKLYAKRLKLMEAAQSNPIQKLVDDWVNAVLSTDDPE